MGSQSSGVATAGSGAGVEIWGLLLQDLQSLDDSLQLAAQSFGGEGLDKVSVESPPSTIVFAGGAVREKTGDWLRNQGEMPL